MFLKKIDICRLLTANMVCNSMNTLLRFLNFLVVSIQFYCKFSTNVIDNGLALFLVGVIVTPPKVKWTLHPSNWPLTLISIVLTHLCNLARVMMICFLQQYTLIELLITNIICSSIDTSKYFQPKLLEFKFSLLTISIQLYK